MRTIGSIVFNAQASAASPRLFRLKADADVTTPFRSDGGLRTSVVGDGKFISVDTSGIEPR